MYFTAHITENVKYALKAYSMLDNVKNVIVAFSGGSDSVTLLHIMNVILKDSGINLSAVHVNHGIRGQEADRDANFCLKFCQSYNIMCNVVSIDIPSLSKSRKCGLEETARNERYRILEEFAAQAENSLILTAHNADDNLETLIFNLARGSAARGLCSIPAVRDNIARPLIFCTKSDILGYCKENGLDYVYDSTNSDTEYTRNFIRHRIVPLLKEINPKVSENAADCTKKLALDCEYIEAEAEKYADCKSTEILSALPYPLLSRIIIEKYEKKSALTLSGTHIDAVVNLLKSGKSAFSVSLPGRLCAYVSYGKFDIVPERRNTNLSKYNIRLESGYNKLPLGEEFIFIENSDTDTDENKNIYKSEITYNIKKQSICGKIYARCREDGDRILYHGKNKTLKNMFNEKKIEPNLRKKLPVICDDNGILLIPFCACRDNCGVNNDNIGIDNIIKIHFGGIGNEN